MQDIPAVGGGKHLGLHQAAGRRPAFSGIAFGKGKKQKPLGRARCLTCWPHSQKITINGVETSIELMVLSLRQAR